VTPSGAPPPVPPPTPAAPTGPTPPPAAGQAGPSNGIAVAALVCGILTFVCLGPIAGILAVIFGFIGLGKAKETGVGRGMSLAGIILGLVGTILSIFVIVILIVAAADSADDIAGSADPDAFELQTERCEVDEFGFATFNGTIENTSRDEKNFTIDAEFRNADNNNVIETSSDIVFDLAPGATAEWSVTTPTNNATQVTCRVVDVENFFN
jgi:hypothetical protein